MQGFPLCSFLRKTIDYICLYSYNFIVKKPSCFVKKYHAASNDFPRPFIFPFRAKKAPVLLCFLLRSRKPGAFIFAKLQKNFLLFLQHINYFFFLQTKKPLSGLFYLERYRSIRCMASIVLSLSPKAVRRK